MEVIPVGVASTENLGQYRKIASGPLYGFFVRTGDANTRIATHRARPSNDDTFPMTTGLYMKADCCGKDEAKPLDGLWVRQNAGAAASEVWVIRDPRNLFAFMAAILLDSTGNAITASNPLPVTTGAPAPGTFTPAHDAVVTVGAASTLVLAAGAWKHIYFRNFSTGGQRITVCGAGIAAVLEVGWTLGSVASGDGDAIAWNHPEVMPIGSFNAIASAAGGKLGVSKGT